MEIEDIKIGESMASDDAEGKKRESRFKSMRNFAQATFCRCKMCICCGEGREADGGKDTNGNDTENKNENEGDEKKKPSNVMAYARRSWDGTVCCFCCVCTFIINIPIGGIFGFFMMLSGVGMLEEAISALRAVLNEHLNIDFPDVLIRLLKALEAICITLSYLCIFRGFLQEPFIYRIVHTIIKNCCPIICTTIGGAICNFLGASAMCVFGFFVAIPVVVFVLALMAAVVVNTLHAQVSILCKASSIAAEEAAKAIRVLLEDNMVYSIDGDTVRVDGSRIQEFCRNLSALDLIEEWSRLLLIGTMLTTFGSIMVAVSWTAYINRPLPKIDDGNDDSADVDDHDHSENGHKGSNTIDKKIWLQRH
mmetsp:Transcript_22478/g.39756  ORF Transcript_22478/g.39756 Transcript_22478/m.39756 type:complete len:365 (-) Transcript_22478:268-1362(-)